MRRWASSHRNEHGAPIEDGPAARGHPGPGAWCAPTPPPGVCGGLAVPGVSRGGGGGPRHPTGSEYLAGPEGKGCSQRAGETRTRRPPGELAAELGTEQRPGVRGD